MALYIGARVGEIAYSPLGKDRSGATNTAGHERLGILPDRHSPASATVIGRDGIQCYFQLRR